MSKLIFHKMHGAGNDFVLFDWREEDRQLSSRQANQVADRRLGIGCDQILIIRKPLANGSLAAYEILNSDGSPAGQCGNGARCIALYLKMAGTTETRFKLDSPSGMIEVSLCPDGEFELDMGEPRFAAGQVPISLDPVDSPDGVSYELDSPFGPLEFAAASMGNPHALLQVDDIDEANVAELGAFLGSQAIFPDGCNIGFTQVINRSQIHLRVFERGAGETLACGSGACAAVALLRKQGLVDNSVEVFLPGGLLVIKWPGVGKGVTMKGPATHVFSGTMCHE